MGVVLVSGDAKDRFREWVCSLDHDERLAAMKAGLEKGCDGKYLHSPYAILSPCEYKKFMG